MNQNITKAILPLVALSCVHGKMLAQDAARPNILYIMCDDHAMQAISAYGSPISKLAPTPNIDRLAQRGMLFRNCFVENSLSTPSRACLMTGLYSHQNGQRQLAEGIDTTKTFVPELMQKAGYETGIVGKWHMMCRPRASITIISSMVRESTIIQISAQQATTASINRRWGMQQH